MDLSGRAQAGRKQGEPSVAGGATPLAVDLEIRKPADQQIIVYADLVRRAGSGRVSASAAA
jgi:hypothetical protein